ncbi:MAG TPA: tetratricopeptide repeat protein [Steroidobacteraceae bacterium]|jgi:predicted negative regulator of RcsB-dependent stress response|nr:tetratricopeptide repeat protein [Steroidobacteraceae bacterium]
MAADDYLTEEEQAEALKKWFGENWLWMAAGVAIALFGLFGWQRYQSYRADRAASAAQLLDQMTSALGTDDAKADSLLKQLSKDYAATSYADQAHLLAAKHAVENGKFDVAASELRTVMDSANDRQLRMVARIRLARVLLQQKKADDALQLLDAGSAGAFAAEMHEVRGDALLSKGDRAGARGEYQAALDAYQNDSSVDTSLLKLKAEELNSDMPAAPQAAAAK